MINFELTYLHAGFYLNHPVPKLGMYRSWLCFKRTKEKIMCLTHNNLFLFDSKAYVHRIVYYFQQQDRRHPPPPFEKKGLL